MSSNTLQRMHMLLYDPIDILFTKMLEALQPFRRLPPIFPTNHPKNLINVIKVSIDEACCHFLLQLLLKTISFSMIGVLVNDMDNPVDHIFLPPRLILQVFLRDKLINLWIAPNLHFPKIADMEHVFKNIKIPESFVQDLKSLESHLVHMKGVFKWNVIYLR